MKVAVLALLCLVLGVWGQNSAREFEIQNALIYGDPFVVGALYVNVKYDDNMDSTSNPTRDPGEGTVAIEYLSAPSAVPVLMTEVYDYFFKYLFQFCTDCEAQTVKRQMPRFYYDGTYYTSAAGSATVNGVDCTGYTNPNVPAGNPELSRTLYIDTASNPPRPCRHIWSTGKTIDFITSAQVAGDIVVFPYNTNSIDDAEISTFVDSAIKPSPVSYSWSNRCPAPTCRVKIDLVVVMDDSGSISNSEFAQQRNFVRSLLDSFTISPDDVRAAVVKFAWSSTLSISFQDDKGTLLSLVDALGHANGATCIGCGIAEAVDHVRAQGRADAQCTLIVTTDGYNNQNTGAFPSVVSNAQNFPCEIFGIGIGGSFLDATIDSFVSPPVADHKFLVNDFNALATVLNSVVTATCQDIPGGLCGAGCNGLCLCSTTCVCPSSCEDFNECTTESCTTGLNANACDYRDVNCNPTLDLCAVFSCDPSSGCSSVPVVCDDGNSCTVDSCDSAAGCLTAALDCDDNNPCTRDFCDNTRDPPCQHETGDCTKCQDNLNSGQFIDCSLERFNPRFAEVTACNPAQCNPQSTNNRYDADDPMAPNNDNGPCEFSPLNCDDSNPCTITSCDEATGNCVIDGFVDCDDGNMCTIDTCDPQAADPSSPCVNTAIDPAVDCFDGNPCTQDLCIPDSGCDNSQPTDCSTPNECFTTECDAQRGGCVRTAQPCNPKDLCHTVACVPRNQSLEWNNETFCVQTEIPDTINECGCLANEVSCAIRDSTIGTIALSVGIVVAIVIAVVIALALGVFGAKKGYDYAQHRKNKNQNWSKDSSIYKNMPSGTNAAAS